MKILLAVAAFLAIALTGSASATSPPQAPAEIVFANGGRIVSIKADGTDRMVLTRKHGSVSIFSKVTDSAPLPSPDGQTVLFTRSAKAPGKSGIMAIDHTGGPPRRILGFKSGDVEMLPQYSAVDWAHDGSRFFAFRFRLVEKNDKFGVLKTDLISVKPDGSGIRDLYSTSVTIRDDDAGASGISMPFDATVSPNGKIALLSMITFTPGSKVWLARVNLVTDKRHPLTRDGGQADISADGKTIVFTSERDKLNEYCYDGYCNYQTKLYTANIDGSNVHRVMARNREGSFSSPQFSPDGSRIAFTADSDTRRSWFGPEIWSVKTDGSCLTRLTNGSPRSDEPAWGAGSITGPAICGQADLRPVVDVTYPKKAPKIKPRQMWLGQQYANMLLSETWTAHKSLSGYYADCGALDPGECPGMISVRSVQVCGAGIGNDLTQGSYSGIEQVRGGLVLNFDRAGTYGRGLSTHLLTGGIDVSIEAEPLIGVKPVSGKWRRAAIDQLRYVGDDAPPATFHPPVFADRTVRTASTLLRNYRRSGSLRKAAIETGIFGSRGKGRFQVTFAYERAGAAAWLRFARDLERIGKVKTVACPRS